MNSRNTKKRKHIKMEFLDSYLDTFPLCQSLSASNPQRNKKSMVTSQPQQARLLLQASVRL